MHKYITHDTKLYIYKYHIKIFGIARIQMGALFSVCVWRGGGGGGGKRVRKGGRFHRRHFSFGADFMGGTFVGGLGQISTGEGGRKFSGDRFRGRHFSVRGWGGGGGG